MKYIFSITAALLLAANLAAATFTSSDNQFTIDMPPGWTKTDKAASVLFLKKASAMMDFKRVEDCSSEACLEEKVATDLAAVKAKKMKIVGNAYTGEDIRRIDFSTGEPFVYINFSSPKTDFSAGYFMFNNKAYSVLTQNMSYAETDLIFSFLSPVEQTASAAGAYDTYSLPKVESVDIISPEVPSAAPAGPGSADLLKKEIKKHKNFTFINKNMPSYIRAMGRGFDALAALLGLWLLIFSGALIVRFFVRGGARELRANPASPYPVKFTRLYGTPSVIFKAKDNQGSTFVSFTTRWSALFMCAGLALIILSALFMCALSVLRPGAAEVYSLFALVIPMGIFIFLVGGVISLVSLREFTIYNQSGKKAVYIRQKGFSFVKENYTIYYSHSKDTYKLERKKFSLLRKWKLLAIDGEEIAVLTEVSMPKAIFRRIFGHLWGMLRASYKVQGRLESAGGIYNSSAAFNACAVNIDKPQAIDALEMMATAFVINIRDMDKFYPWIN